MHQQTTGEPEYLGCLLRSYSCLLIISKRNTVEFDVSIHVDKVYTCVAVIFKMITAQVDIGTIIDKEEEQVAHVYRLFYSHWSTIHLYICH